MSPLWNVLIPTVSTRVTRFTRITLTILDQIEREGRDDVHVTALFNHGEKPIWVFRQALLEQAERDGYEYVSFVDDDDEVPEYYVSEVVSRLDGVDYVGWRMQCLVDGQPLAPTFHSLSYATWWHDDDGYYRDISHLNPMRTQLARQATFRKSAQAEDRDWVGQLRASGLLTTEHFIDRCMYVYHASSHDSVWQSGAARRQVRRYGAGTRPDIDDPHFTYHPLSRV